MLCGSSLGAPPPLSQTKAAPALAAQDDRWVHGALVVAVVMAAVLAYIPAIKSAYIWDDDYYVTNNRLIQGGLDGLRDIWAWPIARLRGQPDLRRETPQYYPLVFTTFWVEHKLWGLRPTGYHVVNVLLHLVNAFLVWQIARRLKLPGAGFIGAVFAVHPVFVESVAWITERKNVLSGLFFFWSLLTYLRFDATGRRRSYALAAVLFVAALLSKSVTAMLPAVIALALFYQHGRLSRRQIAALVPFFVLGAALGLNTAHLEKVKVGAFGEPFGYTLLQRAALIAPSAFVFYASKILWPHPLIFIYPRWDPHAATWISYLPLVGVLAAFGAALALRRRLGWGPLLLLLFSGVTLFPALGFLNVYPHRFSFVADHFQYLGALGFIALFTAAGAGLLRRWVPKDGRVVVGVVLAVVLLLVCTGLSWRQAGNYENGERLWRATLRDNPRSDVALINLGALRLEQGRLEEARQLFEAAAGLPFSRAERLGNLALVLRRQGQLAESLAYDEQAIQLKPDYIDGYRGLSETLVALGRLDEAAARLEEGIRVQERLPPNERPFDWTVAMAQLWVNLGSVNYKQGKFGRTAECAERACSYDPRESEHFMLAAEARALVHEYDRAAAGYRQALALQPQRMDAARGLLDTLYEGRHYAEAIDTGRTLARRFNYHPLLIERLAWLLATCPDDSLRDRREAFQLVDRLQRTASNPTPDMVITFAAVAAENGDFKAAVQLSQQMLAAAREANDTARVAQIERQLTFYRQNKPYRHGAD
jgi:protein O-mannosyl-transferase